MRETTNLKLSRSFKKATAGTLAALMVVTSIPTSGFGAIEAKAADADTVNVYRSYFEGNGEHFMTIDEGEHKFVVASGRNDEGVAWVAPATSETEV